MILISFSAKKASGYSKNLKPEARKRAERGGFEPPTPGLPT
jgi:hypothetical protein